MGGSEEGERERESKERIFIEEDSNLSVLSDCIDTFSITGKYPAIMYF